MKPPEDTNHIIVIIFKAIGSDPAHAVTIGQWEACASLRS
jgi:hypothetical protein